MGGPTTNQSCLWIHQITQISSWNLLHVDVLAFSSSILFFRSWCAGTRIRCQPSSENAGLDGKRVMDGPDNAVFESFVAFYALLFHNLSCYSIAFMG